MTLTTTERKRVEEAVETLARYNKSPYITDFIKQQPKPRIAPHKYDKAELCALIKQVLLGEYQGRKKYVLKLEGLIAYLDALQETGRQHLYSFRLPEEERDKLLARLRSWEEVKALVGGEEELYSTGRMVWEARDRPELALVRYNRPAGATEPRSLLLKWVETRDFWEPQHATSTSEFEEGVEEEGEGQEEDELQESQEAQEERQSQIVRVRVRREERAITFFVIDLENGDCELRIQALRSRARIARQEQLATYRALVVDLFGFEPVGPTVLAPAIRRALVAREVDIVGCRAILPDGGLFIGGEGQLPPVDVQRLQAGVTIRFGWPHPGSGTGRVELDGRLDEMLILRPLLPEPYQLLLERVRRWRREGLDDLTSPKKPKLVELATGTQHTIEEDALAEHESPTPPTTKEAWLTILGAAFRGVSQPEPLALKLGIDRAVREYAQTHEVAEPARAIPPGGDVSSPTAVSQPTASAGDQRSLDQFLHYIKEVAQNERLTYQREIKLVRSEEKWNFRLFVISAVLALTIVATGAFLLLFVPGKLPISIITGLLAALTGRGTLIIRSYAKNLTTKRDMIQDQQRDSNQTLVAIQTALSIPDPKERSQAMSRVASALLSRVVGLVPPELTEG